MYRPGTNPKSVARGASRDRRAMAASTSALPSHTAAVAAAAAGDDRLMATRSASPAPHAQPSPPPVHAPSSLPEQQHYEMSDDAGHEEVCTNPASPSYGYRVPSSPSRGSASLPSLGNSARSNGWTVSSASFPQPSQGLKIEEIDDCEDAAAAQGACDFMETGSASASALGTPTTTSVANNSLVRVQPPLNSLSQVPVRPLVDYGRLIPTGVTGFFQAAKKGVDHEWVVTQGPRLTQSYRAVGMFPFAAHAALQGKSQIIEQNMASAWRTPDASACYYGLTPLKCWFVKNITGPMYAREMIDVPFDTTLLTRSQNGSGVRSFLIEACQRIGPGTR